MKVRIHHRALPHHTWSPGRFDSLVGKVIPLVMGGIRLADTRLISVSYTQNYRTAILLIEVADRLT